jgi:hypothetical protein
LFEVVGVQPADLLVEHQRQRLDFPVGLDAPPGLGRQGPGAVLQHFQVVQPAEEVLQRLQPRHGSARPQPGELPRQLEGVPQLLGGDANRVDPFGDVDRPRLPDGRPEPLGPAGDARGEHELPLGGRLPAVELRHVPVDPLGQTIGVDLAQHREHLGAAARPFALQPVPDAPKRLLVRGVDGAELLDELQRDVQLAHAAERARHAAHPAPQLPQAGGPGRAPQDRQRLAQPPRGDTGVVDRVDVTRDGKRQVRPEGAQPAGERHVEPLPRARQRVQSHRGEKATRARRTAIILVARRPRPGGHT